MLKCKIPYKKNVGAPEEGEMLLFAKSIHSIQQAA